VGCAHGRAARGQPPVRLTSGTQAKVRVEIWDILGDAPQATSSSVAFSMTKTPVGKLSVSFDFTCECDSRQLGSSVNRDWIKLSQTSVPIAVSRSMSPLATPGIFLARSYRQQRRQSLLPMMEKLQIAISAEVEVSTLAKRMHDEVIAGKGVVLSPALIGAWCRRV